MLVRILLESWSHLPANILKPGEALALAARHWQRLASPIHGGADR